jgi:hypothetical protein
MTNSHMPLPFRILAFILFSIPPWIASYLGIRTPEEYAKVAMWLATSEEVRKKEVVSVGIDGSEKELAKVAREEGSRRRVWEELCRITGDVNDV